MHTAGSFTHIRIAAVLQVQAYTALKDWVWSPNTECSVVSWCQMYGCKRILPFWTEIHYVPASTVRTTEGASSLNTLSTEQDTQFLRCWLYCEPFFTMSLAKDSDDLHSSWVRRSALLFQGYPAPHRHLLPILYYQRLQKHLGGGRFDAIWTQHSLKVWRLISRGMWERKLLKYECQALFT